MPLTQRAFRYARLFLPFLIAIAALGIGVSFFTTRAAAQETFQSLPTLTPSTLTLLVGEQEALTFSDSSGRPITDAHCSIDPPIADIVVENDEISISATKPGKAVITATFDNQSASAAITIVEGHLPPGTVRWTISPTPGFETLQVRQATPSDSEVAFYSIEWSKRSNAVLRAFRSSGQQLWLTRIPLLASPPSLRNTLPAPAETYLNNQRVTGLFNSRPGSEIVFRPYQPRVDPGRYGLPPDGQNILLRTSGSGSGGLLILERGRFHDSLVEIAAPDGKESWRYISQGRLTEEWTVNYQGDVGIVETVSSPAASSLLVLNGKTGEARFRIPFPISYTTINGFRCQDPVYNVLANRRPSRSGSIFTSSDGNMYVQVELHAESTDSQNCKPKGYSFDNSLSLLRVTPTGDADWRAFQHFHADGSGGFKVQPRVFAGESIPDGSGGVLAAWTYFYPGDKNGGKAYFQARLSRLSPSGQQRDFDLPMTFWTEGISSLFYENMVLGEGNPLYATNGKQVFRFDTEAGEVNWLRQPPTGSIKILFAAAGGGLLVTNSGLMVYFDSKGNGAAAPWTVAVSNPQNIGLVQSDLFDHTPLPPLQLREVELFEPGTFLAVEDGAPYGRGVVLSFAVN